MKRIVLSMIVMMSMTLAYADNEENNAVENLQAYEMHVSMRSLGRALSLNLDQYDFVEDAMDAFAADLMTIATADGADRKAMLNNAVNKNLLAARGILNKAQYRKYVMLLNSTLRNRKLTF